MKDVKSNTYIPGVYRCKYPFLDSEYISHLSTQIESLKHLDTNILSSYFFKTRGFSIVFKENGISNVLNAFPFLDQYLKSVLADGCNAFYLNVLELKKKSHVKRHTDHSLASYYSNIKTPSEVSILYLKVKSEMKGGHLLIYNDDNIYKIEPYTNLFVSFEGSLYHSVNRIENTSLRLSIICEQYRLNKYEIKYIPSFYIHSSYILDTM